MGEGPLGEIAPQAKGNEASLEGGYARLLSRDPEQVLRAATRGPQSP